MGTPPSRAVVAAGATLFLAASALASGRSVEILDEVGLSLQRRPALGISYGFSGASLNGLQQSLAHPRVGELRIGGLREWTEDEANAILRYRHEYLSLANVSTELGTTSSHRLNTDLWRFGAEWERGYGYALGSGAPQSLTLTHTRGVVWSKLRVLGASAYPSDSALLSLYRDTFRFGTKTEAGARMRIIPLLSLDVSYERTVVFRRHQFWKWGGSVLVEGAVQWLVGEFVDKVMDSSPAAGPVVNFVLRNAVSFAAYQLRKESMYYPFSSEAPLLYDSFKAGVTFIF